MLGHFQRHGADVGAATPDEYVQVADAFLTRAERQGLPTKIDPVDGTIRVYEPSTNTFGAYNADRTAKTFFKPHGGAAYWAMQPRDVQ